MGNRVNVYLAADNIISSLGFTTHENLEAIRDYQTGVARHTSGHIADKPICAALIDSSRLARLVSQHQLEEYTKIEQLFILSIEQVLKQSEVLINQPDCCLIFSTTKGNIDILSHRPNVSFEEVSLWKMAERVANHFGIDKNNYRIISNACISGVSALVAGKRLIESGRYKTVIVSGADVLSHFITSGFASFKSLSEEGCHPFDKQRDGLNLGEACATVLLTTNQSVDGIVLAGGGISNDANHISGPSRTGDGLCYAMQKALLDANVNIQDIDFINTHGTATVYNDEMESKAIHLAGLQTHPVNSLKGYFGHTLGASGVIETIICAHQLKNNLLYGTFGFQELGVPMPITVLSSHKAEKVAACVKTASGFGGCNAAVVLCKPSLLASSPNTSLQEGKIENTKTVRITKCAVKVDEETILANENKTFADFIREIYKKSGESNMKFYKMDDLCKLGYIAASLLLKEESHTPLETGLILANANASLHSDLKHQALINSGGDEAASPSVFVYTLSNVVAGEICIRHKIQGENTFFIQKECDWEELESYARRAMQKQQMTTCIVGWCDLVNEEYQAEFRLLSYSYG